MIKTNEQKEMWSKLKNGCTHDILKFGSGDYYIFCEECGYQWVIMDEFKTNFGVAGGLSGQVRVKIQEV